MEPSSRRGAPFLRMVGMRGACVTRPAVLVTRMLRVPPMPSVLVAVAAVFGALSRPMTS